MSQQAIEQTIIHHCMSKEGFLAKLKVERVFDEDAYRDLLSAMRDCREAIRDSDMISRRVAGCLHFLVYTLLLELDAFPDHQKEGQLVQDAHAECWELVQDILALQ